MTETGRAPPRPSSPTSILQVRKLKPREVKRLAQGHTVGQWQSQDSDTGMALVVLGGGGRVTAFAISPQPGLLCAVVQCVHSTKACD